jgi:hypothetical protein
MQVKRLVQPLLDNFKLLSVYRNHLAIVDADDYEKYRYCRWTLRKSQSCKYVVNRIKVGNRFIECKLHRLIMNTPKDFDCHHKNHNTLDNRKTNLENVPHNAHPRL